MQRIMQGVLLTMLIAALCPSINAQTNTAAVPTYAPVPQTGIGPALSSDGFRLEALGEGGYMITDGVYQALFFVASESVVVVDAPPTIGHNILKGILTVTNLPVSHLVYSHAHADHIGAAYLLMNQNVTVIAHEETETLLAPAIDQTRPLPNVTFAEEYELSVGNQTLQLSYKGPNHEPGNIFIYAPVQKTLMLVDVVYPGWVPFARLGESQNIPGWINAHDQILTYDFDYFVGGHLNRVGTREDVLTQQEFITDLFNNCVQAIQLSASPPNATNPLSFDTSLSGVIAANPGNSWAVVRYSDGLLADWCVNKTNDKWLNRLAGADVYGQSNAETLLESLKIDFGYLGTAGVREP